MASGMLYPWHSGLNDAREVTVLGYWRATARELMWCCAIVRRLDLMAGKMCVVFFVVVASLLIRVPNILCVVVRATRFWTGMTLV